MTTFIANSTASQKALHIAHTTSSLPINSLIIGENGVGKKLLAYQIMPKTTLFDGRVLEQSISKDNINYTQYSELIITNIENILNKKEFFEKLQNIKIVATTTKLPKEIEQIFAVKIDLLPLKDRKEDLEELIQIYKNEANKIYQTNCDIDDLDIDLSQNGISLKSSIYKSVLLNSLDENDIKTTLESFLLKKLDDGISYKELLSFFEIPLLKAAKKMFKSQLQMATKLQINRITLRKKLEYYFGNDQS